MQKDLQEMVVPFECLTYTLMTLHGNSTKYSGQIKTSHFRNEKSPHWEIMQLVQHSDSKGEKTLI